MVLTAQHRSPARSVAKGSSPQALQRVRFDALGTPCEIQFVPRDETQGRNFATAAVAWVQAFEARYSRFRPESLIGRINAAAGREWVAIDADAEHMFALADQVVALTQGILDPTALPLLRLWNYKAASPRIPSSDEVRAARAKVGWARVRREPGRILLPEEGMGLDLGGFGKEYAVDQVALLAQTHGIENLLVDFGHDVRVAGAPPTAPAWSIGVEHPGQPGRLRGQIFLNAGGVATSGDYVRHFELHGRRYGHIVDPRTGLPVANECRAVTVVAASCLEAGLLSTTAFVLGGDAGLRLLEEYMGAEGSIACENHELQTRGYYRHVV